MKKYIVIGASPNPLRVSFQVVKLLINKRLNVVPIGKRDGFIQGCNIQIGLPKINNVDTIILYINSEKQRDYYQYIIDCDPKNVIFNPGAENAEFAGILKKKGINAYFDCALNLLNSGRM